MACEVRVAKMSPESQTGAIFAMVVSLEFVLGCLKDTGGSKDGLDQSCSVELSMMVEILLWPIW